PPPGLHLAAREARPVILEEQRDAAPLLAIVHLAALRRARSARCGRRRPFADRASPRACSHPDGPRTSARPRRTASAPHRGPRCTTAPVDARAPSRACPA